MPRVSEFYGIAIYMHYNEHEPAHFHAIYGEHQAAVRIASPEIQRGELPRRARSLVLEWARLHESELIENWRRARRPGVPLLRTPGLE